MHTRLSRDRRRPLVRHFHFMNSTVRTCLLMSFPRPQPCLIFPGHAAGREIAPVAHARRRCPQITRILVRNSSCVWLVPFRISTPVTRLHSSIPPKPGEWRCVTDGSLTKYCSPLQSPDGEVCKHGFGVFQYDHWSWYVTFLRVNRSTLIFPHCKWRVTCIPSFVPHFAAAARPRVKRWRAARPAVRIASTRASGARPRSARESVRRARCPVTRTHARTSRTPTWRARTGRAAPT